MKWRPKQSACPHCKTIYRYAEMKPLLLQRETECYHCHKRLRVKKSGVWMLALETAAVYALLNLLVLGFIKGISLIGLFAVNLVPAIAAVLLLPLYLALAPTEKQKKQKKQKTKNKQKETQVKRKKTRS